MLNPDPVIHSASENRKCNSACSDPTDAAQSAEKVLHEPRAFQRGVASAAGSYIPAVSK